MLTHELISELNNLNRVEKLRVVQMLVNSLANEDSELLAGSAEYEVWSPYDSADTAVALMELLQQGKHQSISEVE